jgi:hypothetical protein
MVVVAAAAVVVVAANSSSSNDIACLSAQKTDGAYGSIVRGVFTVDC